TQRVTIADSVERIEREAFLFSGISAIRIGDESSLAYVGDYAFAKCFSIQSLNLPDSVNYLGRDAFSNCYEMTRITIPEGVTRIYGPVAPLTNVSEVTIHPGVVWIAEDAFPVFEDEPVTIIGQTGSVAEQFALEHDLGFEALDEVEPAA
ncbi:MAG: leucine-rich repeat domain-containing protein, partial [Oscillospiraceae bacterium]|nr:leucine-rich repeat domain-containing protein [Oscillospiraceae bacterium]